MANKQKGYVLIVCLLIFSLLLVMGMTAINLTVINLKIAGNLKAIKQAHYLAESGIHHAIDHINKHLNDWDSYGSSSSETLLPKISLKCGHYSVTIENIAGNRKKLLSTGITDSGARACFETVFAPNYFFSPFSGIHGCEGISIKEFGTVQSFRSSGKKSTGKEGNISAGSASATISLYHNVHVKGSIVTPGPLFLDANTVIEGSVYTNGEIYLGNQAKIKGEIKAISYPAEDDLNISSWGAEDSRLPGCDPLNIPGIMGKAEKILMENDDHLLHNNYFNSDAYHYSLPNQHNDSIGSYEKNNDYYFNHFEMLADSELTVVGQTAFYLEGDFSLFEGCKLNLAPNSSLTIFIKGSFKLHPGSQIINSSAPKKFMVYSVAESANEHDYKISLASNSAVYGIFYAPQATIKVAGNSSLYGAIWGNYIDIASGINFFYDEDLKDENFGDEKVPVGFSIILRRQVQ